MSAKSAGGRFVRRIADKIHGATEETSSSWDAIQLARHQDRPYPLDYITRLCSDFEELRGDRAFGDDPAIVCGIGRYNDEPVAFIGEQKGRDTQERTYRNFGMPSPEGYRKAWRVMELAQKLDIPLVTLIDTPGAFPGAGAEQRGQGGAIARSIAQMVRIPVPTVAVIVGEGSSGGALAIGVADRVLILANGTYSVISPEGGAAILWRDAGKARLAAGAFKPTAATCTALGSWTRSSPSPRAGPTRTTMRPRACSTSTCSGSSRTFVRSPPRIACASDGIASAGWARTASSLSATRLPWFPAGSMPRGVRRTHRVSSMPTPPTTGPK